MKATRLILITLILLKCGGRVISENHESGDEDTENNHDEVTTEANSEPTEEDNTETASEILPWDKNTGTKEKRGSIISSPSINLPGRREDAQFKHILKDKIEEVLSLTFGKNIDGGEAQPVTTTEESGTVGSTELLATEDTSEFTTYDQTLRTTEPSHAVETTTTEESDTEMINEEFDEEVEKAVNEAISRLQSLIKTLQSKKFRKVYKPSGPGRPWIIDTDSSKLTKRSVPNTRETFSRGDCWSKTLPCPHTGLFRYNESCTKYYDCRFSVKCRKLIPKIRTCTKCLKFNAEKRICDLPENVPECSDLSPKNVCTGVGLFSAPYDCQKYYECRKFNDTIVLKEKQCPPKTVFSKRDGKCVEGKKCRRFEPKCANGRSFALDRYNCSVYYRCDNENHAVPSVCPLGFIFNGHVCEKWEDSKLNWLNKRSYAKVHNLH